MENVDTPMDPTPSEHSRWFVFRLAAAVILLLPAIWFSWKTVDGLAARRLIRTDLAEITNARYGILSADQWRGIIGPMLNAQVDKLDLKGQSKSLRPMVERSLNALLDKIEASKPGGINGMFMSKMIASLRPQVPEYTDVVMAQLVNQGTQKSFKESIRGVLANAVANTFGTTDMTTYNAILKHYGCANGAACEQTLGKQDRGSGHEAESLLSDGAGIGGAGIHRVDGGPAGAVARRGGGADVVLPGDAGRRRAQPDAGGGGSRDKD